MEEYGVTTLTVEEEIFKVRFPKALGRIKVLVEKISDKLKDMLGLQHLHQRKKDIVAEPQTVKSVIKKTKLDLLIYIAAFVGPLVLLPQVLNIYTTRETSGLFLPTWIMLGILNFVWILYGRAHGEKPIVITNVALMVLNFSVAAGILFF